MNFETAAWRRDSLSIAGSGGIRKMISRRRWLIAGIIVAVIVVAAIISAFTGEKKPVGAVEKAAPAVTIIVPGRQQVENLISANGTIAAKRDMPVGVAGEGGMVARVLVEPGQWVAAEQTLAVIDRAVQTQEAQQLAAQIEVARAEAELAQNEVQRAEALVSRGFISKADLDRKRATRDSALARVRVAQAQLGQIRARMGRLDVRAPAAGLVLQRNVEAGQVVGAGSGALFRIAQGGQFELLAELPEADLVRMRVGQPATVTPVGSTEQFQGRIWQVSPVINPQTRQGVARIEVPYHPSLRPGGFAATQIVAGSIDAALLPESAVLSDDRGSYVYVVDSKNIIHRRDVRVAMVTNRGVVVADGLSGNERVVMSAGAFLNPGEKISPQRAASR